MFYYKNALNQVPNLNNYNMQKTILALGVLLLIGATFYLNQQEEENTSFLFNQWAAKHSKNYDSPITQKYRFKVFLQNLAKIRESNSQGNSYFLALTSFADITQEEFEQTYLTLRVPEERIRQVPKEENLTYTAVDWTKEGKVPGVKNQGNCGSCWAFSAIGNIEVNARIWNGQELNLSEQDLVDCGGQTGNYGCNGGWMDWAFEYVKLNGVANGNEYIYTGKDETCKQSYKRDKKITGYKDLGSCSDITTLIATAAVSVAVDASRWSLYGGGVFSNCDANLNHGVLVVGINEAGDYKVRNSWGQGWGEQGYIWIAKGDTCGICQVASYATW
ncbi:hypothetical protein pb186bvf_015132 [Paramecium bursaria]